MTTKLLEALTLAEETLRDIVRVFKFETGTPVEALAVIRAARAQEQAEHDLDTCPGCGGVADNGHDREFPPNPYYCTKCIEQAEQEPSKQFHEWAIAEHEKLKQEPVCKTCEALARAVMMDQIGKA